MIIKTNRISGITKDHCRGTPLGLNEYGLWRVCESALGYIETPLGGEGYVEIRIGELTQQTELGEKMTNKQKLEHAMEYKYPVRVVCEEVEYEGLVVECGVANFRMASMASNCCLLYYPNVISVEVVEQTVLDEEWEIINGCLIRTGKEANQLISNLNGCTDQDKQQISALPDMARVLGIIRRKYEDCAETYPDGTMLHLAFTPEDFKAITDTLEKAGL